MSKLGGAPGLPVHHEDEDDELFETSSSISGDSDDDGLDSDGREDEVQEHQFAAPAPQPVRRLKSDGLSDFSSMMAQLPAKKGLSQYYEGKSQSFACMSEVRCLEDLRKKESPYNYKKKIKSCKSYVELDESQKACHTPGPSSKAIAKKPSGSSCANLMARSNSKNMLYRPPPIPVNKPGYHQ